MNDSSKSSILLGVFVLVGTALSCVTTTTLRNYTVRVYDAVSKKSIPEAQVIVELKDGSMQAPKRTDANGYARFAFPKEYEGKPIRLIVECDGYKGIRQEFDFAMQLPQEVMLTPNAQSDSERPNKITPTPVFPQPSKEEPSPVKAQEVYGILIEIIGNRRIGDKIYIDLLLTNKSSEARFITLFGKGLYGTAKLYSDGNQYSASVVSVDSEESGLYKVRVPGETDVKASIVFVAIPTNVHFATTIEIPYSDDNYMTDGRMRFTRIALK